MTSHRSTKTPLSRRSARRPSGRRPWPRQPPWRPLSGRSPSPRRRASNVPRSATVGCGSARSPTRRGRSNSVVSIAATRSRSSNHTKGSCESARRTTSTVGSSATRSSALPRVRADRSARRGTARAGVGSCPPRSRTLRCARSGARRRLRRRRPATRFSIGRACVSRLYVRHRGPGFVPDSRRAGVSRCAKASIDPVAASSCGSDCISGVWTARGCIVMQSDPSIKGLGA